MSNIDLILWLQGWASPLLTSVFTWITRLGNEEFYLLLIPFIYWSVDRKLGFRLFYVFTLSMLINVGLKEYFKTPRPSPEQVRVIYPESGEGYAFPSGHAQGSTTLWGYLATKVSRTYFTALVVIIVLLVSASRLYLGLHHPVDVLAGIVIGLGLLWVAGLVEKAGDAITLSLPLRLFLSVLPLGLLPFVGGLYFAKMVGYLVGGTVGYALESGTGGTARAGLGSQVVKLVLGYGIFLGLRFGTSGVIPDETLLQVLRYGVIGLAGTFFMPVLFRRLGLERAQAARYRAAGGSY
ncbi:MAG: phosphatase PAP2 family protein [Firmicutes bacterium]|nr:phosphatase PAP2 family protein [Bacillota bacterium]